MKKLPIVILILIGLSTFSQDLKKDLKNSLKFIPHKMIYNSLAVGYERDISTVTSLYFLSQVIYEEDATDYNKGFVQSIGVKNYILKGKEVLAIYPTFYFMPYIQLGTFDYREEESDYYYNYDDSQNQTDTYVNKRNFIAYGGGFLMGLGLTFMERITVDLYFGGGVMLNNYTRPNDFPDWLSDRGDSGIWEGVSGKGGIEFGYKF